MAGLLAAALVIVVLYCLARAFLPALRDTGHRRDLDAWHVAMGVAMVGMLLVPFPRSLSVLALPVFAAGLVWSLVQVSRRVSRPAYGRLAVGCVAMTAMLVPAASAVAAPPAGSGGGAPGTSPGMSHDMSPGMSMPAGHSLAGLPAGLVPVVLVAVLGAVALVGLVALVTVLRRGPASVRRDASCDVAMAAAMGYMLLLAV